MIFMNENLKYDEVKQNLMVKLVNVEKDKNYLENTLYIKTGDIAETLWYSPNPEAPSEYLITEILPREIIEKYIKETGSLSKIFADTYRNCKPIMVENVFDAALGNYKDPSEINRLDPYGSILTNKNYLFGASAAFIPGLLKTLSENAANGNDLILSFTSKHEVVIHKLEYGEDALIPDEILEALQSENAVLNTGIKEKDFLTNKLYVYYASLDTIKEYV